MTPIPMFPEKESNFSSKRERKGELLMSWMILLKLPSLATKAMPARLVPK